ncbi:MAG: hypothetical protein K8S97_13315 [Anaerolineae bacterium]|nr:hypothetical protein [Anaerolineae bacterium]
MLRKTHYLVVLVALLVALLPAVGPPPTLTSAQGTTTVTLAPSDVGVGDTAFVEARIACGVAEGCGAFTVELTFDRDLIRIHSAEAGPFLGDQVFSPVNAIDNGRGTVSLAAAAMQPPPPGADTILFRLEVGGLVPGTAAIDVASVTVANINSVDIPSSGSGTTVNVFETGKIPFFSPPAHWDVVFTTERDGNPEIYTIQADGTNLRRLTDHPELDGGPTWSPNGALIAFHTARDGNLDIYTMDEAGDNLTKLTGHTAADYQPAWSPDGTQIAFVSERDGSADIYVMNADGSVPRRITTDPAQEQQPAWSPDGTQIAFVSNRGGTFELFLINVAGSGAPQQITDLFGANGWHPAWKPNGALLSVTIERDALADIYTMPPSSPNPNRLTMQSDILTSTDWSPDGRYIAHASQQTSIVDLYVIDVEAGYLFRLTEDAAVDYDPDWRAVNVAGAPCLIRTPNNDVAMRVGPGWHRGEFTSLPPNQDFFVISQFTDASGELWYELDKTQIAGHAAVNALWVPASEVEEIGDCPALVQGTPPPVIPPPGDPGDDDDGDDDDDWEGCGSCDTCGHPTHECITTPDGECVWDPRTCAEPPPGDDDDDDECYFVTLTWSGNGQAQIIRSPPNCDNGYDLGSTVTILAQALGVTTPGQVLDWTGSCANLPTPNFGTSQIGNVTVNGNCTVHVTFSSNP